MNKKTCKICLEKKDLNCFSIKNYLYRKDGSNYIDTKCKKCKSNETKQIYHIKKIYKKPIHKYCNICEKYCENLCLDHDHKTKKFRGWLCRSCNVGLGRLGDDLESIKKVVQYLKQSSIKQFIE